MSAPDKPPVIELGVVPIVVTDEASLLRAAQWVEDNAEQMLAEIALARALVEDDDET